MQSLQMQEPLRGLFSQSRLLTLDFAQIGPDTPQSQNIQHFFEDNQHQGIDPKLPEQRQAFNNRVLDETGARYLVSRYGEDRASMLAGSSIAQDGRTLHLGIDIFCRDLETVYAPCDGEIIAAGQEPQGHSFGYYIVFKPTDQDHYLFFGHLSAAPKSMGLVKAGARIGQLGDFADGENGGWSRHLHIQLFRDPPLAHAELLGYSTARNFAENSIKYPNPMQLFPDWQLAE